MSETSKKAILRALLEGTLTDLHPETTGDQVMLDETTTLSAKLAEFITALNGKASSGDLTTGLSGKADTVHTHAQADVTGLVAALAGKASSSDLTTAIANLRAEIMGGSVPATLDTLKELADYIEAHEEVATALNTAIGAKADKSAVDAIQLVVDALGALANKDKVSEADVDAALLAKINAASEGNHTHANKALLDTYTQTNANLADAVAKKHSHSNATVLNSITADKVTAWDGKSRVLVSATQPADLAAGDLWIQTVD